MLTYTCSMLCVVTLTENRQHRQADRVTAQSGVEWPISENRLRPVWRGTSASAVGAYIYNIMYIYPYISIYIYKYIWILSGALYLISL